MWYDNVCFSLLTPVIMLSGSRAACPLTLPLSQHSYIWDGFVLAMQKAGSLERSDMYKLPNLEYVNVNTVHFIFLHVYTYVRTSVRPKALCVKYIWVQNTDIHAYLVTCVFLNSWGRFW